MADNKHLTPVWIMYADGKRLDVEHEGALRKIVITDRLNGISSFSLTFDTTETKVADKGLLSLESQLAIHLGYKDDVDEVFSGEILEMKAQGPEYGTEQLEVSGYNVLHKLTHGEHTRSFEEKTPSDIIKGLIDGYSLKAEVDDFGAAGEYTIQDGYTDYDYLMQMAIFYGKDVFADKDTIYIANDITIRNDEIILEWGKSLINFEASQSIKKTISGYDYVGWDPLKNESFTAKAAMSDLSSKVGGSKDWTKVSKGGSGKFIGNTSDLRMYDADEAKQRALGLLQKNSFQFGYVNGKAEGNYKLRPGMRITMKMIGERFEGEYIAETVTHRFDYTNGYTTSFIAKRNMCS